VHACARMRRPCSPPSTGTTGTTGTASGSSGLTCASFVNILLALVEQAAHSMNALSNFKSAYTMHCNYLLPCQGASVRCAWAGGATAHSAADFMALCKLLLPKRVIDLYRRMMSRCIKLQAAQRGHVVRKKWKLGPSCCPLHPPPRSSSATQQLATQAISASVLHVSAPQKSVSVSVSRRIPAKLSPLALELLAAYEIEYSAAMSAAVLAGAVPLHAAALLRLPAFTVSLSHHLADEKQKALVELRRPVNRISRFLRGCVQRQTAVAVAAAMSLARRTSSQSAALQSLELYPLHFPAGISLILVKSFSSGFKLHSAVRALLSDMRSNLACAALLLRRQPLPSSRLCSVTAVCAVGSQRVRLPSRSVASFVSLQFLQEMPLQGQSRIHLAPLTCNPGVTRNQQVAALCFGQPLHGGRRNDRTHAQWLETHWSGLAVAAALHALQDYQLLQLMVTVDRVLIMGDASKTKAATDSTIASARAAEGSILKQTGQPSGRSTLRDAATEFLTVCARVARTRSLLYAALPHPDSSTSSTPAIFLQSTLILFNDLSNNFLLQLTQRQRRLLVTTACIAAFHILVAAIHIQRCTRGHAARRVADAARRRAIVERHRRCQDVAAGKICRSYRLHCARCAFRSVFALRVQRVWRGHVSRRVALPAKVLFRVKTKVAAAALVQRVWKRRMTQRWFIAACNIINGRSMLRSRERDGAIAACVRNCASVWAHASNQREAKFVSSLCCRSLLPILLKNQQRWAAAGLFTWRRLLLDAEADAFAVFMANASLEAERICFSQISRAWKGFFCRKRVTAMLHIARKIKLAFCRHRASQLLQTRWRSRCAGLQFCAKLKAYQLAVQQRSSSVIVRSVQSFKSRRTMQHLLKAAAACTIQRSFRVRSAKAVMATAARMHSREHSMLCREVAAGRLQSVLRGWRARRHCCGHAARMAAFMLSWNRCEQLRYDSRLRLAIVIARHSPYVCSVKLVDAASLAVSTSTPAAIMRRVAESCFSIVGSSIAEWGFKCILKAKTRCRALAQVNAHQTIAALLLQAAYRAHIHRRKHYKPFLPKYRAAVLLRRRVECATRLQCFWRSSVARLALACLSTVAKRGRWMTRTRWAHGRAKRALLPPHPPQVEPNAARRPPTIAPQYNFFDSKLNGWCTMAHSLIFSVLLPNDSSLMQAASSLSFQLCQRIEGFTGAFPSSDRFFGGDPEVASLLQLIEGVCPQHTSRCWDAVCSYVPNDPAIFAADPSLSPAHAILSYFRQFVSGMLAQQKPTREREAVLFSLRSGSQGAGVRAAFVVHLPSVAANNLRHMLLHSSAAVLASVQWLFSRWGNAELMGGLSCSCFMFPVSNDAEFVHECHGVWGMLLHCHVRPMMFCLEMLVSSMSTPLFQLLYGADAALVCSAISALLMLMSFWLQTTLHPQHAHCQSSLWMLFAACTLESKCIAAYYSDSLRKNAPSVRLNAVQLLHAAAHEHLACVSAALGQHQESIASLMRAEALLAQLSASGVVSRRESDSTHGPPSLGDQLLWRRVASASALLFACCGSSAAQADECE
jgi:hypothetical protein